MSTVERATSVSPYRIHQPGIGDYARSAWAVLIKDLRCELRARQALSAVLLFAVTSTVAVSFGLGAWGSKSAVASAMLWIVIYFSAMSGLSRSFVREDETYTAATLKLAARPNSVYLGKLTFNWATLIALEIVTVPLFALLTGCSVARWGLFIAILTLGGLGLSAGATMAACMVARAVTKGALFAVISFPLLIPVLAVAIHGSDLAMRGGAVGEILADVRLLAYYCGIVITASLMLFRFIWED
ncbi:MAG: heme exporter protein CcmB [Armatimonadetes bacterium]|nr:heme exporter protein CcmB [Armatimonadota bacterium]